VLLRTVARDLGLGELLLPVVVRGDSLPMDYSAAVGGAELANAAGVVHPPMASDATPPTAMPVAATSVVSTEPEAERRLLLVLDEVSELSPWLHAAALRAAADRLGALAAAREQGTFQPPTLGALGMAAAGSPLRVEHLSFTDAHLPAGAAGGERDDAGSFGSLAACSLCDEQDADVGEGRRVYFDDGDDGLWGGGTRQSAWWDSWEGWPAEGDAEEGGVADAAGVVVVVGGGHAQPHDSLGLSRFSKRMYCDYHDGRGTCPHACMAVDMLQQRRISTVVDEQRRELQRRPFADPDRRSARHNLYRAVVKWHWSDPLGAENRVRLPRCVMHRIRQLFPNPACCDAQGVLRPECDLLDRCEKRGHYTGFLGS
jgi:hypothetical protein